MPPRPTWKGYLKVSLVNIPVKVYPATEASATISFNQLHAECQTRINQKKWCSKCEREVTSAEVVKGYEFEKGRWVVMTDEDIAKVRTESTKVINLVQFAGDDEIDPMYVDRAYYLVPDGAMATDAYAVMRDGMQGKVGVGKVAIHGRESLVAVKPHKQGLVMYTLHHAAEIRTIDQIDELREVRGKVEPGRDEAGQAGHRELRGRARISPTTRTSTRKGCKQIIDAKVAGEEFVAPAEEAPPKVVDLMEALRRSLDQVSAGKKKTAKVEEAVGGEDARRKPQKNERHLEHGNEGCVGRRTESEDQKAKAASRSHSTSREMCCARRLSGIAAALRSQRPEQPHPLRRRIAQPVGRREPDERENRDDPDVVGQRRALVPPEEGPPEQPRRRRTWTASASS